MEQLPGARPHWCGQMTAWCTGRWPRRDCLVLFRGGMGMAQRFSAWLPRDKLLPRTASPEQLPSRRGVPQLLFKPRRMCDKIQARPAGKLHTGSTSKEMNTLLFSKHIFQRAYTQPMLSMQRGEREKKKREIIAKAGRKGFRSGEGKTRPGSSERLSRHELYS